MSQAASQASAFYKEVARTKVVWTVKDDRGFPAPKTSSGRRAQPFWSSRSRAERIIKNVPAYKGFMPHEISWSDFESRWVLSLIKNNFLVGVNWSGPKAVGYDLEPERVMNSVKALIK